MYTMENNGKSIWWDLAFAWLREDDPVLAERLMQSGKLDEYLDTCAMTASCVLERYVNGDVEEDAAAELLVSAMLAQ